MTGNKGAAIERGKLTAWARRKQRTMGIYGTDYAAGYLQAMDDLVAYTKGSADRATKTPGGLGRKK